MPSEYSPFISPTVTIERDRAIEYLRELVRSVEKGEVDVRIRDQALALTLPDLVKFEISWKEGLGVAEGLSLCFGSGDKTTAHKPMGTQSLEAEYLRPVSMQPEFLRTEFPAQEPSPASEM